MSRVYTIENIHDGRPLSGIADFDGQPHFYQCQFDEQLDDWSDRYALKKIDTGLFALALERQEIFLRWRKAFDAGKVSIDAHPSLTSDRPRYNELEDIITSRITALPETAHVVGRFEAVSLDQFAGSVQWATIKPQ